MSLREAVRLFAVQGYYTLRPPKTWVDGMGGQHPVDPKVQSHMLAWSLARHENRWVAGFRKWASAAASLALLVTAPLWVPLLIAAVVATHLMEKRAHSRHTTPDRDCFWCQTRPKMVEQHWFHEGVPIRKPDSHEGLI